MVGKQLIRHEDHPTLHLRLSVDYGEQLLVDLVGEQEAALAMLEARLEGARSQAEDSR